MKWGLRGRLALRRIKQFRRSQQGQMSVMIAMMMTTFILFFCFVVNTGMLVNAKINLQNAADLAAYAGAATQARLLNQISFLNYEMRRQYKKFLFRYYVIGNMAQDGFPLHGAHGHAPIWSPDGGTTNYGLPVVCIMFNPQDNYCHVPALKAITIPPRNPLDQIESTLVDQLTGIETIRKNNCAKIGETNSTLVQLWLWNTDPSLQTLITALHNSGSAQVVQGLALGLGLLPKEFLLQLRVKSLASYVNEAAQKNVTKDMVDGMLQEADPAAKERTIQAFYSAYFTLGNHTFNGGDVIMDELVPNPLLVLKEIHSKFSAYAVDFKTQTGDCDPHAQEEPVQRFTIGFSKDRSNLTYYAIRLKAKARVMFNPFGPDVELKAYAAAQPFGSRIGPELPDDQSLGGSPAFAFNPGHIGIKGPGDVDLPTFDTIVPNLPITQRDSLQSASEVTGWDTQEALFGFYDKLKMPGESTLSTVDEAHLAYAYQSAMVPNPIERGQYNIIEDLTADPFVKNFDTKQQYAFWAPLVPPGGSGANASDQLKSLLQPMLPTPPYDSTFVSAVIQQIGSYVNSLHNTPGEDGEGFNIARLNNPFVDRVAGLLTGGQPPQPINIAGGLAMTSASDVKTSWNAVNDGDFRALGRTGYSVKFVSFDSLTANKQSTDSQNKWTNGPDLDAEAAADVQAIRH